MIRSHFCAALVIGSLALPALAAEKETVDTLTQELEVSGAARLMIDFPVGNLAITGDGTDKIVANIDIRCSEPTSSACRRTVERAKIKVTRGSKGISLKIEGWPKTKGSEIELSGRISMPPGLTLEADVDVGDLTVSGLTGDVALDVEVGNATVNAKEADIAMAILDAGVGKARLKVGGSESQGDGLVGQDLKWTGKGSAKLDIDVNVGDILVNLD